MTKNREIQAVVFDLDGLMFNTEAVFDRSGRELLRRRGKEMTEELLLKMMGRRPDEAFMAMIQMMKLTETIEELKEESQLIFAELVTEMLAPMPGLFELLDHIEDYQLPKAVATSSPRPYLEDILGRFDLLHRFPMTLTAEDVVHGKPNPEIYLKSAEKLGIPVENMLVLEDSEAGTNAAASAGAYIISIPHEHSRKHNFKNSRYVATSLADPFILDLISS